MGVFAAPVKSSLKAVVQPAGGAGTAAGIAAGTAAETDVGKATATVAAIDAKAATTATTARRRRCTAVPIFTPGSGVRDPDPDLGCSMAVPYTFPTGLGSTNTDYPARARRPVR